jgi:uncharacterized phosphosugar-binding protein
MVIGQVAEQMADVIAAGHLIYVFGATHAGILAEELFYRAGGLVPMVPIFGPGLTPNVRPVTLTTQLERLSGYAELLLQASGLTQDDLLLIHSVSGRNTVAIELAEGGQARGVTVVALTNVETGRTTASRHPKGIRLIDVADYIIDNCGVVGDALVQFEGLPQRVGPTSTVVGAALANALVVETVAQLLARGLEPPVFRSANVDHSDTHNARWLERYRPQLSYL